MIYRRNKISKVVIGLAVGGFVLLCALIIASTAPGDFPQEAVIVVAKGATVSDIANQLMNKGVIRSKTMFKVYVTLLAHGNGVKTGNYFFDSAQSVGRIAYRMTVGELGVLQVKITIPEGLASPDLARIIKKNLQGFDDKTFLSLARPLEGHLFPDTYFFDRFTTPQDVISAMQDNFNDRTAGLRVYRTIMGKRYSFDQVLTMASLVEEEATSSADRRLIAGILWKRIAKGMPLQVDAPFFYLLGKTSAQLTRTDLATSSPYNLYKHLGLPPTPIDNPGMDSIVDAANPTDSKYWFFLSGTNGRTYYAETLDEHVANMKHLN